MPEVVKNSALRFSLFAVGVTALILGAVGAFLPVLPTTPFVILAAFCFIRSSPKAHAWLYRQRLFGPALRDWDHHRVISRKAKILAITMMLISAAVMWVRINNLILNSIISLILLSVAVFILTRKEQP
ncbi:YbaN family protein [Bdellovibrio sp. HCB274]|uniref:YbaN family protein n=1 Tax=Bdellovibrio sp. HCB274 TaxID=3394361 RepID=UPI0039B3F488